MSLEALMAALGKGTLVPFFLVVNKDNKMQFNMQRMIEAVIIGIAIALVGYLTVVPRLEERLTAIQQDVEQIRNQNLSHASNGHPWTVIEQVRSVERRVDRLEKQRDAR